MPVELRSPKKKVMNLDGEYDPMIAEENETLWWVKCEECGKEEQNTTFDLSDRWAFEFSMNTQTIEITDSKATCYECIEAEADKPATKARHDKKQQKLGAF